MSNFQDSWTGGKFGGKPHALPWLTMVSPPFWGVKVPQHQLIPAGEGPLAAAESGAAGSCHCDSIHTRLIIGYDRFCFPVLQPGHGRSIMAMSEQRTGMRSGKLWKIGILRKQKKRKQRQATVGISAGGRIDPGFQPTFGMNPVTDAAWRWRVNTYDVPVVPVRK